MLNLEWKPWNRLKTICAVHLHKSKLDETLHGKWHDNLGRCSNEFCNQRTKNILWRTHGHFLKVRVEEIEIGPMKMPCSPDVCSVPEQLLTRGVWHAPGLADLESCLFQFIFTRGINNQFQSWGAPHTPRRYPTY
jgi:hypothetical protein